MRSMWRIAGIATVALAASMSAQAACPANTRDVGRIVAPQAAIATVLRAGASVKVTSINALCNGDVVRAGAAALTLRITGIGDVTVPAGQQYEIPSRQKQFAGGLVPKWLDFIIAEQAAPASASTLGEQKLGFPVAGLTSGSAQVRPRSTLIVPVRTAGLGGATLTLQAPNGRKLPATPIPPAASYVRITGWKSESGAWRATLTEGGQTVTGSFTVRATPALTTDAQAIAAAAAPADRDLVLACYVGGGYALEAVQTAPTESELARRLALVARWSGDAGRGACEGR